MSCLRAIAALFCLLLSACETTTIMSHYPLLKQEQSTRKILIAVDGTGSDLMGRSNPAQLYELIANQDRENLATFYTEGVGTDNSLLGLSTGKGLSNDIREAYGFLANHWTPGSKVYLTGFSRGAYTVRALAGMVAVAGIIDLGGLSPKQSEQRVARVFAAYAVRRLPNESREAHYRRVSERVAALGYPQRAKGNEVKFAAAALWDTVAALWAPDRSDDPFEEEPWFVISNCNFEKVFHALAIDDNRAYSFTPLTVLREKGDMPDPVCPDWRPRVEEVWFSGAHADVGGSYSVANTIHGYLPGVSMRWMLSRLRDEQILPVGASVYADPDGPIHNAKAFTKAYRLLYYRWRNPYYVAERSGYSGGKPVLHRSVLHRLKHVKLLDDRFEGCRNRRAKPQLLCTSELLLMNFLPESIERGCLVPTAAGYELNPARDCFVIVDNESYFDPLERVWKQTVSPASF